MITTYDKLICGTCCYSGQGADSEDGGGGRDRAESGGWIDLGREEKLSLVRSLFLLYPSSYS
jgi:hypothetical protein